METITKLSYNELVNQMLNLKKESKWKVVKTIINRFDNQIVSKIYKTDDDDESLIVDYHDNKLRHIHYLTDTLSIYYYN